MATIALADGSLVIPLSTDISLMAADLSLSHNLAFADAVIYASARKPNVELVTSEDHFQDLPDVTYFPKKVTQTRY
jgi:predicted nucleic acid-binding protein